MQPLTGAGSIVPAFRADPTMSGGPDDDTASSPNWLNPDSAPPFGYREIQVWWTRPQHREGWQDELLDEVERARCARFRRPADRDRFVTACSLLRLALARCRNRDAADLPIVRTCPACGEPHGKPRLDDGSGLEVSLSHSGERVVVIVSSGAPVGVDVEQLPQPRDGGLRRNDAEDLAARVLSPIEHAAFQALSASDKRTAFLEYWTRKEAVLKATGDGLRVPLTRLAVSGPLEEPILLAWRGRPEMPERITLHRLHPGPDHVGALAVIGGPDRRIVELDGRALLAEAAH